MLKTHEAEYVEWYLASKHTESYYGTRPLYLKGQYGIERHYS
ncbi:hypothetical protein C8D95_102260 [Silicimonas algicola]|uniref:Uncharacterized protein n=1 Tax=Silicimonas algicola TaxID=1826607 RepID=A0A316GBN0_9RHOB|nr:hypothetical protein C8D95_102260 [Silicimonas algicola]